MADYDSPWKEVLDRFFALVLAFLLPKAHEDIDWTEDHESLETELRKVLPESEVGPRRMDKLVKVYRKGTDDPAYLHVEAQMFGEEEFERRMYVYNSKAEQVYNSPIVSVALLGDANAGWRPRCYRFELWGCVKTFTFVSLKLLKWRGKERMLEKHANPFAVFLLAHLQTLATQQDEETRAGWKARLMRNIVQRELDVDDRREWLRLIDWLMELPHERNQRVWASVRQFLREMGNLMPFLSNFEERERDAEQRGRDDGKKSGLLEAIQMMLSVHLPKQEKALLARAEQVNDLDLLRRVLKAAMAADVKELKRILP